MTSRRTAWMLRWSVFVTLGLVLLPLPLRGADPQMGPVPVVDLRVHLPFQVIGFGRSLDYGSGQADLARMRRGGVTGVVLPLVERRPGEPRGVEQHAAYELLLRLMLGSSSEWARGCVARGPRMRAWYALEGAGELATRPSDVGLWSARGVRLFGLVSASDNALGTAVRGSGPEPTTGLTPVGRRIAQAIYAAGGVIDVSHASAVTVDDVIAIAMRARAPVVASHSNARALADHPRNLSDAQIRQIAETGGLVGITFERSLLAPGHDATLPHVVRQVQHVARVGGIDHVAIGSGFEGGIRPPHELLNASRFPRLAAALMRAGMTRTEVERVFSKNALRVLCPSPGRGHAARTSQEGLAR